jgi:acid phosphatase
VVVVMENHSYADIIGSPQAPYINTLAGRGALFTQSFAVAHPSEPNYLALFSGSTQGITSDACPVGLSTTNLAAEMASAGEGFAGYSESLPATGFTGCSAGSYARKHAPWADFPALPPSLNQPMSAFPADLTQLPRLCFVIPNLADDMHDGTITEADRWLATHLSSYAAWAQAHDSLLILTTDEDDRTQDNHITTLLAGAHVRPGSYPQRIDHYGLLRTLTDSLGIAPLGNARNATPLSGMWLP